jgi:hypothetical protein
MPKSKNVTWHFSTASTVQTVHMGPLQLDVKPRSLQAVRPGKNAPAQERRR